MNDSITYDDIKDLKLDRLAIDDEGAYVLPQVRGDDGGLINWRIIPFHSKWILEATINDNGIYMFKATGVNGNGATGETDYETWNTPSEALEALSIFSNDEEEND